MNTTFYKFSFLAFFIAGFSVSGYAQKLPDVQTGSVIAPAGIRADGKNNEWNDSFQALNKRTDIFYTIANDDNNLYLAIKSTDPSNNMKIFAGGITFSINPDGKKKEKESITLTYPVINRANFRAGGAGRRQAMGAVGINMGGGGGGQEITKLQRDSMMAAMQRTQLAQVKEIKISGFKNTADSVVSIYNEFGIKAVASIGEDHAFFYEVAIPLAALGMTKDTATEFAYNIKLNGFQMPGLDGGGFGGGGGGRGGFGGGGRGGFGGGGGGFGPRGSASGVDFQAMMSPTDFWGKYKLARK